MSTNPRKSQAKNKNDDTDAELVQAIQSGRVDLFQTLVSRYEEKLYNFGLRMCRNVPDAEDLVQDTFLNVFKYLKGFRQEAKFKNWLYRIATSVCIKKRRKKKCAPERTLSMTDFLPRDEAEMAQKTPQWATIPLDQLLNEELAGQLNSAIHALPPKYRMVAVLRDIEGFSTGETAKILEITPANVKVRLHRARLFLREELKEYFKHDRNIPST
jgi:RNA polymerase sigma-70 factor (ECF subfamily)